jgi:4-hydroxybenzoyl-CoA thioesterase
MSANRLNPHIHTVQVGWGHSDPAGIVFYPNFFAYFDEATWALFYAAGLGLGVMKERYGCLGIPLVDAQASFKSPCRFRDVLTIESHIADVTEKTFAVMHRVLNHGPASPNSTGPSDTAGREALTGREVRIWGIIHPDDPKRLKAMPLPADVLKALGV